MSKKVAKKLPSKPSELIRVALEDLRKAERSKHYVISMQDWHKPTYHADKDGGWVINPKAPCNVCLAGSVMAGTLGVERGQHFEPFDFGSKVGRALEALNDFRTGDITSALDELRVSKKKQAKAVAALGGKRAPWLADDEDDYFIVDVVDYDENPEAFKLRLEGIAATLESVGL